MFLSRILSIYLFPWYFLTEGIKEYSVEYHINENDAIGKMVGTISSDIQGAGFSSKNIFEVKYKMGARTCCFSLNEDTGILTINSTVDLEKLCEKTDMKIDCSSNKGHIEMIVNLWHETQLSSVVRVGVSILDVNDNIPKFSSTDIRREVSEASHKSGHSIYLEGATDSDISLDNCLIEYSLSEHVSVFQLNKDSLREPYLLLLKDLDAEECTTYRLKLRAWNPGNYKDYSELSIEIVVLDFNDNPPRFNDTKMSVLVKEKMLPGKIFFQLGATDPDKTSQLRFSLDLASNTEIKKTFKVWTNGSVTLTSMGLDYEKYHSYQVSVCVSDGLYDSRAVLEVLVEDENDEYPQFLQNPSVITVTENASRGLSIGQVIVSDKDSAYINGKVVCENNSTSTGLSLNLSPTRQPTDMVYDIRTDKSFDRELSPLMIVRLICSDGWGSAAQVHLTNSFTVTIHVQDVNDNAPVFQQSLYNAHVMENSLPGTAVVQVSASDLDDGNNGQVTYSLPDDDANQPFSIDSVTGWIKVRGQLDREQKDSYQIKIFTSDKGNPPFTGTATVTVSIDDDNDHNPILLAPFEYRVSENEPPHVIGHLNAEDSDSGRNGAVTFLQMWGGGNAITIMENGTIFANISLNREDKARICIRLRLLDNSAVNRRKGSGEVCVIVTDVNDNSPRFVQPKGLVTNEASLTAVSQQPVSLSIYELPGHVITQLVATDNDDLENAKITYHIEYPEGIQPGHFLLNSSSGYFILNTTLSSRDMGEFRLRVIATDAGTPPLSDIKTKKKIRILNR